MLDKTRRINRMVQRSDVYPVGFQEMANVLCELIGANTYIVDREGGVLGHALPRDFECEVMEEEVLKDGKFPTDYNEKLLRIGETAPNMTEEFNRCVFKRDEHCKYDRKFTTVVPITGGGERLGTLILSRYDREFAEEDLVLAEYGSTVIGMDMMKELSEKKEEEARKKTAVQVALNTLSYSELEAIKHIFDELGGHDGLLVASKVADRVGITRSVIVNALRKFESAGIIESRSLGMKGTHIRILNEYLIPELNRMVSR